VVPCHRQDFIQLIESSGGVGFSPLYCRSGERKEGTVDVADPPTGSAARLGSAAFDMMQDWHARKSESRSIA
jgi:hypothetical protein